MSNFDLKNVPQEQLVAFYGLIFAAAAADGHIDKEELIAIYESIDLEPLSTNNRQKVQSFLINPPSIEKCLNKLALAQDELRFAIVVGICEVILADDIIEPAEQEFLNKICRKLNINDEQKEAIINFVKEGRRIIREGLDDNTAEKVMKNAVSSLAAVGVPVAAVYFSGTVIGLSAAGITSGLAALGLGLGMVPGIGVAILIGTGVFLGLRKILGDSKKDKEEQLRLQRERKAQLVIKNLQEAINNLALRISELEKKAELTEANEKAINLLRDRLLSLQRILRQKKAVAA